MTPILTLGPIQPEHPGTPCLSSRRGEAPPNAAPTIQAPAGVLTAPAGPPNRQEEAAP